MASEKSDQAGKIVTVRDAQPGSYMFKIRYFLLLTESDMAKLNIKYFESPVFQSCGHKWKMLVYPYGNQKQGVRDHVSLYLVSTDAVRHGSEINATFKMFVYDHIRDNFLTIQDCEVRRFHKLREDWGFSRLISLDKFKDPQNGYLANDHCVFGVEISVIPPRVPVGCYSVIKEPEAAIFTWKLNNFSSRGYVICYSDVFNAHGRQWRLMIYPNGDSRAKGTHLSLFLQPQPSLFGYSKVYAKVVLGIRNHLNEKHSRVTFAHCFDTQGRGCDRFISLDKLKNKSNGYIADDCVTFEAEVNCISKPNA